MAWQDLDGDRLRIGRQRHSHGDGSLVRERTKSGPGRTIVLDATTLAQIEQWRQQVVDILGETGEWAACVPTMSS